MANDRTTDRWLVVGLGNPGNQYEETRHNVGFMLVQKLADEAGITGKTESRFNAIVGAGAIAGKPVILAQPLTFMNLSGEAVAKICRYYQIPSEQVLAVYDEAALPFGRIRLRPDGSAAGHNGIKSLIQHLGGQNFPRVRIGIGAPAGPQALHAHVLAKFTATERADLDKILTTSAEAVRIMLNKGLEAAMTRFNGLEILA